MTLEKLALKIRRNVNDENKNIFSKSLIEDYINEGINRLQSRMYFADMVELVALTDVPIILPAQFHYLLALYASARCFQHDERHYQYGNAMNEFENKFDELIANIEAGEVTLYNALGEEMDFSSYEQDSVTEVYNTGGEVSDLYLGVD